MERCYAPRLLNTEMQCMHSHEPGGCDSLRTIDTLSKAFTRSACAPCKHNECKSVAGLQLRQRSAPLTDRYFSWWLALRASVLRRAVSSPTRPALRRRTSSVTVGRATIQLPCLRSSACASNAPEQMQVQIQLQYPIQVHLQVCAPWHSLAAPNRCGLTTRSTGPIAACRHLG